MQFPILLSASSTFPIKNEKKERFCFTHDQLTNLFSCSLEIVAFRILSHRPKEFLMATLSYYFLYHLPSSNSSLSVRHGMENPQ
mmetsp:Transcript_25765/g.36909  ORF Transcript_25765/g.36909 Transcript_25765/m.36909 type:complete len:84 (-) Transcript_25765:1116-1367(-)